MEPLYCPTLIIKDSLTPVEIAKMMNAGILNSEFVVIPGASHVAILEAADGANAAILDWAASLPQ